MDDSTPVLRAMLEADGNPNTRDEFGRPTILMNWYLGYYKKAYFGRGPSSDSFAAGHGMRICVE
jgi:hypothetical protein